MKSKYQCPYCQYISLKKWNIERHVKNIHCMKNFPDRNNVKLNIDPQNIRLLPCPIHSSDYRPNQEQQHDVITHYQSNYQPSQEEHKYGKRFKDASTQYSKNDINHSTIPLVVTKTADQIIQEKETHLFEYDRNIYEDKSVENCKKRKPVVITSKGVFILE